MSVQLKKQIATLRKKIQDTHLEARDDIDYFHFKYIDEFLESPKNSDLEKAFFLMLNQFTMDPKNYFVIPHEQVLVPNVYDNSQFSFEYEIDFAVYSGSKQKPIKIAIECDGLRSHREKYSERDRRKDINLQAAGWIVIRFGSKEIHKEIESFQKDETHISEIAINVENIVERTMDLITHNNYVVLEIRSMLTGYEWGTITCPHCDQWQMDRLNKSNFKCRHCNKSFTKERTRNGQI